jgi:hypothetical protein
MCDTKVKVELPQVARYFNGTTFAFGMHNVESRYYKVDGTKCQLPG